MTDTTNGQAVASKKPTYHAFHVRDNAGNKSFWTRIGSAWSHADGQGLNIQVEMVPLDGRITLRIPSEETN